MELKINLELSKEQVAFLKDLAKNDNLLLAGITTKDLLSLKDQGLICSSTNTIGWAITKIGLQVVDNLEPDLALCFLKEKGYGDVSIGGSLTISCNEIKDLLNGYLDYVHNYMGREK